MPFKIYTYGDPYQLDGCHFWEDIRDLPHLCVAQTQANAIRERYGNKMASLICPIDKLLKHAYGQWHDNVPLLLRQHQQLTNAFTRLKESGQIDEQFFSALNHNKREMLDAIRLFVELGISTDKLERSVANPEQLVFLDLLQQIAAGRLGDAFQLYELRNKSCLDKALQLTTDGEGQTELDKLQARINSARKHGQTQQAKELKRGLQQVSDHFAEIRRHFEERSVSRIVIHGVHQFSPLQLRLIQQLDQFDVEVIFLYNYQSKFNQLYSTWSYVYRQFGEIPEADRNGLCYEPNRDSRSNALAMAMAGLYDPQAVVETRKVFDWHKLFAQHGVTAWSKQKPVFIEFDNVTEFANYVAGHFDRARDRDPDNPLAAMQEHIYSADRAVHELLKVYYPDYAGERHFLAYPVGQFFVALYRMWNGDEQRLDLDMPGLANCLASGLLRRAPADHLISIFQRTSLFYEDVTCYDDFMERMGKYIDCYQRLHNAQPADEAAWLTRLSVFNVERVSLAELQLLKGAVEELESLARALFSGEEHTAFIKMRRHFEKLEEFVRLAIPALTNEVESQLLMELLGRFDHLSYDAEYQATIGDLREGLYYYLRQREREHERWIVRNFEQIDGDVLRSREQKRRVAQVDPAMSDLPVYHFAGLSDRAMNRTTDELLPWPLTDRFIQAAYFPVDLVFRVYYASLGEYKNFLRYALFYGLYFNECDVRLSYVKNDGNEQVQPYFPLGVAGLEPRRIELAACNGKELPELIDPAPEPQQQPTVLRREAVAFLLCPYRYLLDYVLNTRPVHSDKFVYRFFYANLLVHKVWSSVSGQLVEHMRGERLQSQLREANRLFARYFPYWSTVNDLYDLTSQATNYLLHQCVEGNGVNKKFKRYDRDHMGLRLLYRMAAFFLDSESNWQHPYPAFNQLAEQTNDRNGKPAIKVSLHSVKSGPPAPLVRDILAYLNSPATKAECPQEWCQVCPHKLLCLQPYAMEDFTSAVRMD